MVSLVSVSAKTVGLPDDKSCARHSIAVATTDATVNLDDLTLGLFI